MVDCQFSQEYGAHNQMGTPALVSPLARPYLEGLAKGDCIGGQMIVVPKFWKVIHCYPARDRYLP